MRGLVIASGLSCSISLQGIDLQAIAQVTPDGTLSTTVASPDSLNFIIDNGTRSGTNLFHSFSDFSVPTNGSAMFNNAVDITNILNRVTGDQGSSIDGLIQSNGSANLFLINPNGMIFGPNAQLDIGGSFNASTAESIVFDDNIQFSATDPNAFPLLSINVPIGLQMGANAGSIQVNGPGHNIILESIAFSNPLTLDPLLTVDRTTRSTGLQVSSGNTLALVGGDITIEGGNLTAFDGRVELGSVGKSGVVDLASVPNGFTFNYGNIDTFSDISFRQAASIDVSGSGSGDLHIQGKTITLQETSTLLSQTVGEQNGGHSRLRASESILFQGIESLTVAPTAWFNQVEAGATGNGGTIAIETGELKIDTNAFIASATLGQGNAGDISIHATDFETRKPFRWLFAQPTGLFSTVLPNATGRGADLNLYIDQVQVDDLGTVQAITLAGGEGGDLTLLAQDVAVSGISLISTATFAAGNAGDLRLQAERVYLVEGGQIGTPTFGRGDAGELIIQTTEIEITGAVYLEEVGGFLASLLASSNQVDPDGNGFSGNSGRIIIDTVRLRVTDGGGISTGTKGSGNGADLVIRAQDIEVSGSLTDFGGLRSGILMVVAEGATGQVGNMVIDTDRLRVIDGGSIRTNTLGGADAGDIQITADSVEVSGSDILRSFEEDVGVVPSEISASSATVSAAGSVEIDANVLRVSDSGLITAFSTVENSLAGSITVDADTVIINENGLLSISGQTQSTTGVLTVDADRLILDNGSIFMSTVGSPSGTDPVGRNGERSLRPVIRATDEASGDDRINIDLDLNEILILRRGSFITANALGGESGANIEIDVPVIATLPGENSDIIANAEQGQGGNITLRTDSIIGMVESGDSNPRENRINDISASSDLGIDGTVEVINPEPDPASDTVALPSGLSDESDRISTGCFVALDNSFTVIGRGGLPDTPTTVGNAPVWEDWRSLETESESASESIVQSTTTLPPSSVQGLPREATAMRIQANGQVEFVASTPSMGLVMQQREDSCITK